VVLPSNQAVLVGNGVVSHFFVDSAEGATVVLDVELVNERADAAAARLLPVEDANE
jgi:hypothetical protein